MMVFPIVTVIVCTAAIFVRFRTWSRPNSRPLTLALVGLLIFVLGHAIRETSIISGHLAPIVAAIGQAGGLVGLCLIGAHVLHAWSVSRLTLWIGPIAVTFVVLALPFHAMPNVVYGPAYADLVGLLALTVGVGTCGTAVTVFNASRDSAPALIALGIGGAFTTASALTILTDVGLVYAKDNPILLNLIYLEVTSYSISAILNAWSKKKVPSVQSNPTTRGYPSLRPMALEGQRCVRQSHQVCCVREGETVA